MSGFSGNFDEEDEDDAFGDLNRLQRIIGNSDDRGTVLALAAFAEDALGELIEAFLIDTETTSQLLRGFNAPLGTLSARIRMAYALGLVTKRQFEDLDRLRRIRNEFAHAWKPMSFSHEKIAPHVAALHFSRLHEGFPASPIEKVRTSLSTLLIELRVSTQQISRHNRGAKLIGQHLVAGLTGEFDDQLARCRERLTELAEQLKTASGQQRRFLLNVRHQWEGKLEILKRTASSDQHAEVRALQAEFEAWNIPPDE